MVDLIVTCWLGSQEPTIRNLAAINDCFTSQVLYYNWLPVRCRYLALPPATITFRSLVRMSVGTKEEWHCTLQRFTPCLC